MRVNERLSKGNFSKGIKKIYNNSKTNFDISLKDKNTLPDMFWYSLPFGNTNSLINQTKK
jgi:hypothetical protein